MCVPVRVAQQYFIDKTIMLAEPQNWNINVQWTWTLHVIVNMITQRWEPVKYRNLRLCDTMYLYIYRYVCKIYLKTNNKQRFQFGSEYLYFPWPSKSCRIDGSIWRQRPRYMSTKANFEFNSSWMCIWDIILGKCSLHIHTNFVSGNITHKLW